MRILVSIFLFLLTDLVAEVPRFATHELATDLKGGYQVVVADVNGDGKPDLIALASGMPDLIWFENPGWQRHVLGTGFKRMINCAFDLVDGKPFIVLAHEFDNDPAKSIGVVSVLTPGPDVYQPWHSEEIDRLPTSHRLRILKLQGKTVVLNVPLAAATAHPPDYRGSVPIVFYRPGIWKRELIGSKEQGVTHGVLIELENRFLIASFLGIHRYVFTDRWTRTQVAAGSLESWPKSGASDVTVAGGLIAAIEPWHGNQVVVYDPKAKTRKVIDDQLVDGHTIFSAMLSKRSSNPSLIAGYRGKGTSVYIYDPVGDSWRKSLLDDTMAAAACTAADLNSDGRIDLICIGASTMNLKWYENLGQ